MESKVLTVSIAGYNVESTLEEALDPFFKCKTLDKIEVLIVNDGSNDRKICTTKFRFHSSN